METTNPQTTSSRNLRPVLAAVLAVCALGAIGVHELAPDVILAIRAKAGFGPAPIAVQAPAIEEAALEDEADIVKRLDPDAVAAAEVEGPAKQRPLVVETSDGVKVKRSRQARP